MKQIKLKNIGVATAISLMAVLGITGVWSNFTSIEITQMQFDSMRNELALECFLNDGEMEWNKLGLFISFANEQNKDDGGSIVKTFSGTQQERFVQYCRSMIRLQ